MIAYGDDEILPPGTFVPPFEGRFLIMVPPSTVACILGNVSPRFADYDERQLEVKPERPHREGKYGPKWGFKR